LKDLRVEHSITELTKVTVNVKAKEKINARSITSFILFSVVVHALLVYALVSINMSLPESANSKKTQVIKSYLYKVPKKMPLPKVVEPLTIDLAEPQTKIVETLETKKAETKKVAPKTVEPKKAEAKVIAKQREKTMTVSPVAPKVSAPPFPSLQSKPKQAFSVQSHLSKLRNSIDNQIVAEEMQKFEAIQPVSAAHSIVHKGYGLLTPVPHVEVPLTQEQKIEKNTIKMDDSISIIKGDDGTCTIIREAFPGSPVPASVSSFACGESKFDKSFREHMARVRAKTMSITNTKKN